MEIVLKALVLLKDVVWHTPATCVTVGYFERVASSTDPTFLAVKDLLGLVVIIETTSFAEIVSELDSAVRAFITDLG